MLENSSAVFETPPEWHVFLLFCLLRGTV
jgi:hypothetical protein